MEPIEDLNVIFFIVVIRVRELLPPVQVLGIRGLPREGNGRSKGLSHQDHHHSGALSLSWTQVRQMSLQKKEINYDLVEAAVCDQRSVHGAGKTGNVVTADSKHA